MMTDEETKKFKEFCGRTRDCIKWKLMERCTDEAKEFLSRNMFDHLRIIAVGEDIQERKLIDAYDFYHNLTEWAITDKDREFAEEVKYALDKQEQAEPMEIVKAFYNLPQDVRIECCKQVYKHVD